MSIQTQHLRRVIWPLLNPDTGLLPCHRFKWKDLAPAPGVCALEDIREALQKSAAIKRFALLHIAPDVPDWVKDPRQAFLSLVKEVGSRFGEEGVLWGVDVTAPGPEEALSPEALSAVAEAFRQAFPHARRFVAAGSPLMPFFAQDPLLGLIVTEDAQEGLEKWEKAPLRMAVDPSDRRRIQQAIDRHVSILEAKTPEGANAATHAGYRFEVLAVEMDDGEKQAGKISVKVTLANSGSLPCYTEGSFSLRLSGSDVPPTREYPLGVKTADLKPGDEMTVCRALDVAGLPSGEYDVHVGLFFTRSGYPVSFGIEGRISDGYYEGRLILRL